MENSRADRIANELHELVVQVRLIREILQYQANTPVGFRITETLPKRKGEIPMAAGANVDFQILDDGAGVLFTLTPVNANGSPVPLPAGTTVTATSSAPGSLAVAPNPGDTTGLWFLGTVPQPPVDATGIVVTFSAPFGSTAANPIDVIADGSPVGFTIQESAAGAQAEAAKKK